MSIIFPHTRINLDFEWENDLPIEINYKLLRLEGYLEDTEFLMEESKNILIDDMHRKFEGEMDPRGQGWKELVKPEKEQIGILRRGSTNAAMYEAATSEASWVATPTGVFFDSGNLPEYWLHHEQPDGGAYRIPKREFVAPTEYAQVEIETMAGTWLEAGVREATTEGRKFTPFTGVFNPRTLRFHHPSTGAFMKTPLV